MENKSKKSKALIITIIAIILLLIIGYFLFKNKDNLFAPSSRMNKIFSSLSPSDNKEKVIAQAGEDIKKGDSLSTSGTNANGEPIVVKAGNNSSVFGFANEDILNGNRGEITINPGGSNNFWDSFSDFLNSIFSPNEGVTTPTTISGWVYDPNGGPNGGGEWVPLAGGETTPTGGWTYDPTNGGNWIYDPNGVGGWVYDPNGGPNGGGGYIPPGGGWTTPPGGGGELPPGGGWTPQCSDTKDNDGDGHKDDRDPNCVFNGEYVPTHYSESISPIVIPPGGGYTPQCSDTKDNDTDGAIDKADPNCHSDSNPLNDASYLPNHYSESISPVVIPPGGGYTPQCSDTKDNDTDTMIDIDDPNCHVGGDLENGDYVPTHYSESISPIVIPPGGGYTPQCSDTKDNDTDGAIDKADPNCHSDSNPLNDASYLPNHYSESVNPQGGGIPDLIAGAITPTTTTANTPTTLSSVITNTGLVSTGNSFSTLFVITKGSNNNTPPSTGGDNNTTLKPGLKNTITKFFKKVTSISKATAVVNVNGNGEPVSNIVAELTATTPKLWAKSGRITNVSYTFSQEGTYNIRACADKDLPPDTGFINELDEGNNCGPWTVFTVTSSLPTGTPDLVAGAVTPTTTIINASTKLSSVISNSGDGSTESSFSSFFAIVKIPENIQFDDGNENIVSKSWIKNIFAKIFNKITSISKAFAVLNTNDEDPVSSDDFELSVVVSTLPAKTGNIASVTHSFTKIGAYKIRACADKSSSIDTGAIIESNENNNCGPWILFTVTSSLPTGGDLPECSDTIDNDKDEKIDILDPTCHLGGVITGKYLPEYDSEANSPKQCNDTIDNDDDTTIDIDDFNCHIGGDLTKEYLPTYDSESNSPVECNDTIDNDDDTTIDKEDPNCHIDGDLNKEYVPMHYSESISPATVNECLLIQNNPLTFTDAEKAELAQLLRKFYLIAPTLKTTDDIEMIYSEIDRYSKFGVELDELIEQCYRDGIDREGVHHFSLAPAQRLGNPWFKPLERGGTGENTTRVYIDYNRFDADDEDWGTPAEATIDCKYVAGYYVGNTLSGESCDELYTPAYTQNACWETILPPAIPNSEKGCTWREGAYLINMEYLLNVW